MSVLKEKTAFCGAIVGRRKSGKTTLFVDLMRSVWLNRFSFVVWISPTVNIQKWIWGRISPKGFITLPSINQGFLQTLIEYQSEEGDGEVLVVMDDIGLEARREEKNFGPDAITQLAFAGRHYNISCLFLAQRFLQIPPSYRSQMDFMIFFGSTNTRELNSIHAEFSEEDAQTFRDRVIRDLLEDDSRRASALLFMNKNGKKICKCTI